MSPILELERLMPLRDLAGVEVYSGSGSTPAEFDADRWAGSPPRLRRPHRGVAPRTFDYSPPTADAILLRDSRFVALLGACGDGRLRRRVSCAETAPGLIRKEVPHVPLTGTLC